MEKLKTELKTRSAEVEKLKKECDNAKEAVKRMTESGVEEAIAFYKARTPKKPTDMNTKLQMKKMVDELEGEIGKFI